MPTELFVADFFVYASMPFTEKCRRRVLHTQGVKENAFSEAQNRAEVLCRACSLGGPQTKEDKIRIGSLTLAFSEAQKRAKMLGVDCESLTPTQGATQQVLDCESLTPTQEATQQCVDCNSLTPTQGATQKSLD